MAATRFRHGSDNRVCAGLSVKLFDEQKGEPSSKPASLPGHTVPAAKWRKGISHVIGAGLLFYLISRFVPYGRPLHYSIIDDSWIEVFHKAFAEHWQFGREIVFTFGPWGFLYGGYLPATHLLAMTVWTILAVVFWWAGRRVAFACFQNELTAWLWLAVFSAVSGLTTSMNIDTRMTAFILLLWLVHFFVEERPFSPLQASLAVALGLFGLIKFSLFIAGGVAVSAIAIDIIWRHRRFPWVLVVFGASVLVFWSLAGQSWISFGPFLVNSWRITAGYSDAMGLNLATEGRDIGLFLMGASLLGAVAGYAAWQRHRRFALLSVSVVAFLGFSAFKYGYVRHDQHEVTAVLQLLTGALACLAAVWPVVRKEKWMLKLAVVLPAGFVFFLNSAVIGRYSEPGFLHELAVTFGIRQFAAPVNAWRDTAAPERVYAEYLAPLKDPFRLPGIDGNVDIYPWNQAALFANGLSYRPRPVIQSYSVYTPELAEMNAAFLRGTNAPDNIFFSPEPMDGHFPALEDGRSWPELLTRYDLVNPNLPGPLLLKRAANPRHCEKVFLAEAPLTFDIPVTVPAAVDGPVWAEIEIDKSLAGDVLSALYKLPPLQLAVTLSDGRQTGFRLIPGMARGGFILSPFIGDQKSFSLLVTPEGFHTLGTWDIQSITISSDNRNGADLNYYKPKRIRFYRLDYGPSAQGRK
jgi:hypothetical protein